MAAHETRPASMIILGDADRIYSPSQQKQIAEKTDLLSRPLTAGQASERGDLLEKVELIFSGWAGPLLDEPFLASAPQLKALFYGAGALSGVMTRDAWRRGIIASSAWVANAQPVAEYTLGMILPALKQAMPLARRIHSRQQWIDKAKVPMAGAYGSTVAIISLGVIGRKVAQLLAPFDVELLAFDPMVEADETRELGAEPVSLEDAFARADVVSIHAPWLPETQGMITGELIASMKPSATLINTSRGALIREDEMTALLEGERRDLTAILDVTHPEPPVEGSKLFQLENVFLTPHIAGSLGDECHRMGQYMLDELDRYLAGEPLLWAVSAQQAENSTHRPKQ